MRQGRERQALFWRALAMAVHKVTQLFSLSTVTGMKLAGSGREAWPKKAFCAGSGQEIPGNGGELEHEPQKRHAFCHNLGKICGCQKNFQMRPWTMMHAYFFDTRDGQAQV